MTITVTLVIIVITCIVSFAAFNNDKLFDELIFFSARYSQSKPGISFFHLRVYTRQLCPPFL